MAIPPDPDDELWFQAVDDPAARDRSAADGSAENDSAEDGVHGPWWPERRRGLGAAGLVVVVAVVVALLTVVGLAAWWPRGEAPDVGATVADLDRVEATVTGVSPLSCVDPLEGFETECERVAVTIRSGPDAGTDTAFLRSLIDRSVAGFEQGDDVILVRNPAAPPEYRYTFVEFQRDAPLVALGVLFVVVVVGFGRRKGLRALGGLAASMAVVVGFLLPSLLRDNHPVGVALVATAAVAFLAIYLAHGVSLATTVALLGSLAAVLAITGLAWTFTGLASLTGLSDESLQILSVTAAAVDPRGILVAGMVIGALGVLDDVTVTQVSAVAELRRANPDLSRRELYGAAVRIGRDHVASTVNTLVLAYVGASLSLMLFFFQEGRAVGGILGEELVAIEIVRMLVGSIGLVLSVPLTTALAVAVAHRNGLDDAHGHAHGHAGGGGATA